jgi:hypothetical protein
MNTISAQPAPTSLPLLAIRHPPEILREYGVSTKLEGMPSPSAGVCHISFSDKAYAPGGKSAEIAPFYGFRNGAWECRWLVRVVSFRPSILSMSPPILPESFCLASVADVHSTLFEQGLAQSEQRYQKTASAIIGFLAQVEGGLRSAQPPAVSDGWWVSQASSLAQWLGKEKASAWIGHHGPVLLKDLPAGWWEAWDAVKSLAKPITRPRSP